jgi:hypothetical protein
MKRRQLTDFNRLVEFQQQFEAHSRISIPMAYYESAQVTGVYNRQDALIGGYVTAPGEAARWFNQVPMLTEFQACNDLSRTIELNAVWLTPEYRMRSSSAQFWLMLANDLATRDVTYIVFMVDLNKAGLARLYKKVTTGIIYEGRVINSSLKAARICYATPRRFRVLPVLYALDLLQRFIRSN